MIRHLAQLSRTNQTPSQMMFWSWNDPIWILYWFQKFD